MRTIAARFVETSMRPRTPIATHGAPPTAILATTFVGSTWSAGPPSTDAIKASARTTTIWN
jgi:hypothetical protein